ncbi:hypothetical protein [Bordetella genomosp. 13]|uniref:Lactate dehydrogenase n=1 Tax=Bordetella genomosp. 13 TaxID=463040 RepID=A0A1W6ZGE7_9BORD|nr:hypothetical protein [Bordetella genomosp. 13]ARP96381.1 hypothetical protein CAL15_19590 [Bordetella genomosp. 13]
MTTISSLGRNAPVPSVAATAAPAARGAVAHAAVPQPSTRVALGRAENGVSVYTEDGKLAAPPAIWSRSANDPVTAVMGSNFDMLGTAGRFSGLGAALLERAATATGDFSQSVHRAGSQGISLAGVDADNLPQYGSYISLDIKTAGGATVQVVMGSNEDGMAVQTQVTGGTLDADEEAALAGLTKGFQAAIDGLTARSPKLDLTALTQYDSQEIASIDLRASVKTASNQTQTLEFHADGQTRAISANGPEGRVDVRVDMSKASLLGSAAQQQRALDGYLRQIDDAGARGRGSSALVDMFKSAFASLHGDYGSAARQTGMVARTGGLDDTSRGMLSGLADFEASVSAIAQHTNALQPGETDAFAFQASQQTATDGLTPRGTSIVQTQHAQLTASYRLSLSSEQPLALTADPLGQNYSYHEIEDRSRSTTRLEFDDGRLVKASLSQSVDLSERVRKYVRGQLVMETTIPTRESYEWDLLSRLADSAKRGNEPEPSSTV